MTRLLDCFSALLSFGLALDASIAAGRAGSTCEEAQRRAIELLDEARAAAERLGKSAGQIDSALFAMVAWIDEILSRHPGCEAAVAPLQMRLFNSSNAQTEFFHHLSALPADEQEVREVYWHALALGFKGQYYFESDDNGELGKLKDLHGQQLAIRPASLDTLAEDRITPQPYGVPDPPVPAGPAEPQARPAAHRRGAGGGGAARLPDHTSADPLQGDAAHAGPARGAAGADLRLRGSFRDADSGGRHPRQRLGSDHGGRGPRPA
ncbi:DotU family type IV/VI secretion system protein [Variovorax ureilyticus]|uniref:DotU family type IV/VI secretion system protein n=1 Tax=Variovorax ureilyticus TaxID=1836198 RepID=UPI003D67129B